MEIYNNLKVRVINLPELTNGLQITDKALYITDRLNKLQELVNCKVKVEYEIIIVSNKYDFERGLVFMNNGIETNKVYTWMNNGMLYINSTAITSFIKEQLSSDNDTLFIPKLV